MGMSVDFWLLGKYLRYILCFVLFWLYLLEQGLGLHGQVNVGTQGSCVSAGVL